MIWIIIGILGIVHSVQAQNGCPFGYREWNGYCYNVFTTKSNYGDADHNCRTNVFGGHLASIKSNEENAFIFSMVTERIWIGFDDLAKEGEFYWTDGSVNGYKNWAPGEPNHTYDYEDCTHMHSDGDGNPGMWNDHDCNLEYQYICKVPVSSSSGK
ncbi:alpha-N-acetylgalactosamine-specific lectin-like [Ptychodera flava]|uniref:alpha-N-acetylgalactosamine-specific lectin-like n=1 Tax=Ptychodera flava TaxID=63121 RepID=UPI00396A28E0